MKNQNVLLTIGVSCIILGIIVAYISTSYLPGKKKEIEASYAGQYAAVSVFMIEEDAGLYSNTTITEELFTQGTIRPVLVPTTFLPKDKTGALLVYTEGEKATILKKRTNKKLVKGEFLLKKALDDNAMYPDEQQYKRRKEYTLKNNVAGEVKAGCLVDVMVNYLTGDYDVVISKIKVEKVITTAGAAVAAAPAGGAAAPAVGLGDTTVILAVDEMQFRDIELAEKMGQLQARVYEDEEQAPSLQTFKYSVMKSLVKQIAEEKNLSGDIDSYSSSAYIGFYGEKGDFEEKLRGELQKFKDLKKTNEAIEKQQVVNTITPVTPVTPVIPETPVVTQ
ncbi:MAG TPA: hypothetical protein DCP90_00225 [Clostridiales bacterium]|nr:MAG: hypothetical protein A2Y22_04425 [Clostridiales bacterium GWD2_32_59]HAN09021.1 hypothetical protein [Clostridiales bacterium]